MKTLNVRITFTESILGTSPANTDIYRDFIGSKAPDAATAEEEVAQLGVDAVVEKGMTVFPRDTDGTPFIWDYQMKGMFKDACGGLRSVPKTESGKLKSYKKTIDKNIFAVPRRIHINNVGKIGDCQRPLRAQTMKGERISIAISEEIQAGCNVEFKVIALVDEHVKAVREWLDYGTVFGWGQWRSSGHGRFYWEELDDNGNVIYSSKDKVDAFAKA